MAGTPFLHGPQIGEFLGEFGIYLLIWNIAARRHIEIVNHGALCLRCAQSHSQVAGLARTVEITSLDAFDGQPRQGCDPVIGFLPVDLDIIEAQLTKIFGWKAPIGAFDFLKAQNVGLIGFYEALDMLQADTN